MNIGRGLLRAWVLVTVLWFIGLGFIAYSEIPSSVGRGKWQYSMRPDIDSAKADWNGPYYDSMRSPSYEKLEATFFAVEYGSVQQWDKFVKEGKMISIEVPDHSSLYLSTAMNKEDQEYLARAFWDQRWGRYLVAVKYWLLGLLAAAGVVRDRVGASVGGPGFQESVGLERTVDDSLQAGRQQGGSGSKRHSDTD